MAEQMLKNERTKSHEDLREETRIKANSLPFIRDNEGPTQSVVRTKRENNLLVPINQLPAELLIAIFHASLETFSDRFEGLKTIASVTWLWCSIIKQSPGLWALLDSRTPAKHLPIFLQRSNDLPLTIKMHPKPLHRSFIDNENSQWNDTAFLDGVTPELARWKEASLILEDEEPGPKGILEQPAPLLKKFHMEARRFWHSHQVDLFQGQAPELGELSLQGVPIYWNSSIFRDLRSISIRSIVSSGPTVEEVFQWIASSPRLESFHLCGSRLSPSTVHRDILPVEIPYLKTLQLSQLLTPFTESILSQIRAPALRKLVVQPAQSFATWAHWPTFFDASLLHFSPTIVSSITHARSLAISIYAPRARICVSTMQEPDQNEGIKIDFDHPQGISGLQSCLEPLLRNVPVCPQISLTILALMNVPETDLLWILDSEVNDKVTEISIRNPADDSFLAFLCKARGQAGITKWPFPRLKRLLLPLSTDTSVERLARSLKERYAPDRGELSAAPTSDPQPPLILEAPDRLSFLSVANTTFNRSEYDLLSNIVGPDVLQAPVREDDDRSDGSENTLN